MWKSPRLLKMPSPSVLDFFSFLPSPLLSFDLCPGGVLALCLQFGFPAKAVTEVKKMGRMRSRYLSPEPFHELLLTGFTCLGWTTGLGSGCLIHAATSRVKSPLLLLLSLGWGLYSFLLSTPLRYYIFLFLSPLWIVFVFVKLIHLYVYLYLWVSSH